MRAGAPSARTVWWVLLFTAALAIWAVFQARRWKATEVFEYDPGGYVAYLHSVVIEHQLGRCDSLAALQPRYRPQSPVNIGLLRLPTGAAITKYPIGLALTNAPWYVGAHLWTRATGRYRPDGYDQPYQQAITLAGVIYGLLGLVLLTLTLRYYFAPTVVAWTIAAIGLGTNLLCYMTYDAAMAHAALFIWQAGLLLATARWYAAPRPRYAPALGIGLCLGMATITRPTDALLGLVPLLWGLTSRASLRQRFRWLGSRPGPVGAATAVTFGVVGLQLLYWRLTSGHWVLYSYDREGFDFRHPHLLEGLFSFRKGWLLYTPLMGLALAGIVTLGRWVPAARLPLVVALPVILYVTFSWWQWWYGGAFSARPLISLYPLLALALGSLLAEVRGRYRRMWPVLATLISLFTALNLLQTWQYHRAILHWENTTANTYFRHFFTVWK